MTDNPLFKNIPQCVQQALAEDIGSGDITAELIPRDRQAIARVICREDAIICGEPWVNEVFHQVDPTIKVDWQFHDGQAIKENQVVFYAKGCARSLLTAERSALNFLQTISSVSTKAAEYADLVKHTKIKVLDTRKTIPGLRHPQKYGVEKGGCFNHRVGLYDAFLIKENHINACGGISAAINNAGKLHPNKTIEIEVETLAQMETAIITGANIVLLDNFTLEGLRQAVSQNAGRAKLEASGGYNKESIVGVAETGIDFVSVGSLTKHCQAIDFTMLF